MTGNGSDENGFPPCPYCRETLHLDPKGRAKCKACEQWVYPGREQQVFDHHPLTEEENDTVQQLKRATRTFAVSWNDVEEVRGKLAERFGHSPNPGDILWGVWNELLSRQPDRAPEIRLEMARQRHREGDDPSPHLELLVKEAEQLDETQPWILRDAAQFKAKIGLDPTPELARQHRSELKRARELGATEVAITTVGNGCRSCQELDGQTFTVDEALEAMPLPNPDCTHSPEQGAEPLCRCSWHATDYDYSSYEIEVTGTRTQKSGCLVALASLPVGLMGRLLSSG